MWWIRPWLYERCAARFGARRRSRPRSWRRVGQVRRWYKSCRSLTDQKPRPRRWSRQSRRRPAARCAPPRRHPEDSRMVERDRSERVARRRAPPFPAADRSGNTAWAAPDPWPSTVWPVHIKNVRLSRFYSLITVIIVKKTSCSIQYEVMYKKRLWYVSTI